MISLLYHDVVSAGEGDSSGFPGGDANIYKLDRLEFEAHLNLIEQTLKSRRVETIDSASKQLRAGSVLFTFDDGGASATSIGELLENHNWRGHFFVTTDYIGKPGFLTATQIRDLHARGHVIGSHSCSHPPRMSHCTSEQLMYEWSNSVRILSEIVGIRVKTASVPGGYYSIAVARAAASAGIEVLFNSEPENCMRTIDGCLVIGRYSIQQGVSARTAARIASEEWSPRAQQYLFWNVKKFVKRAGGSYYIALRKSLLKNAKAGTK